MSGDVLEVCIETMETKGITLLCTGLEVYKQQCQREMQHFSCGETLSSKFKNSSSVLCLGFPKCV